MALPPAKAEQLLLQTNKPKRQGTLILPTKKACPYLSAQVRTLPLLVLKLLTFLLPPPLLLHLTILPINLFRTLQCFVPIPRPQTTEDLVTVLKTTVSMLNARPLTLQKSPSVGKNLASPLLGIRTRNRRLHTPTTLLGVQAPVALALPSLAGRKGKKPHGPPPST